MNNSINLRRNEYFEFVLNICYIFVVVENISQTIKFEEKIQHS